MLSKERETNTYVIDVEEGAETARLLEQDLLYNRAQGGLLPEELDVSSMTHLLDIGCGPGGWALEVAYTYRHLGVVGIDINPVMVNYAFAQARSRGLENISFEVMDARKPLEFPDTSFDLINARFIAGFMDQTAWPVLLGDCLRLLKPGGYIRLTEMETATSNSPALEKLHDYLHQALKKQKRSFSVDGRSIGVGYMLGKLLREAGFRNITKTSFFNDSSYGAEQHYSTSKDVELLYPLIKPYFIRSGIVDERTFDETYAAMVEEVWRPQHVAISFGLTTCAQKALD
ncbi:hypothetical protein KDH_14280 [Dictyobacter sp. S3.2.2.5]|uniref:Methyltransferase domain-containing protein n=1 Tax=Dictyobacter halimunensis TaxID=3026934 RepID=A0ABQ6FK41_9CHLR|nr:hypothetical protein KDH_14280 [Dictyobacter sp. S3.2.2.5]